jgi:hypothetical protein
MTSEGFGEMFEGDSADTGAGKFPLLSMGGRAGGRVEGLTCADPGARTPIGASGNFSTIILQYQYQVFGIVFQYKTARLVLFIIVLHAGNITTRHLQRVISFNTIELYMKGRIIDARNVNIR